MFAHEKELEAFVSSTSGNGYVNESYGREEDGFGTLTDLEAVNECDGRVDESGDADHYSCWHSCTRGIRSVWATRLTEDTQGNRDLYINTTLRELVLYALFLITLMIVAFGPMDQSTFLLVNMMEHTFLTSKTTEGDLTLENIDDLDNLWKVIEGPVMQAWYNNKWYNDQPVSSTGDLSIGYTNYLLGAPRIRQLRVSSNSCYIPEDFQKDIKECYASYSIGKEDREPFGLINGTAWRYQSADNLSMGEFWGATAMYSGGGYYLDFSRNGTVAKGQLAYLFSNLWLDRGTRAVFLHFSVYNANLNLFCIAQILVEVPSSGGVILSYIFRPVKLLRYVTTFDYFMLACECILLLFILYYIVEEIMEISKHRLRYFVSIWNWLDIIIIVIILVCTGFNIYRTIQVNRLLTSLLEDRDIFPNFQQLSAWQEYFNYGVAVTVFLAWIKLFKYISFNKTMTQLSSTLGNCAKDLAGFSVMFCIVFFSFAELGYLAFGTQVKDFSMFSTSIFTLFRIILGDFDFNALEKANRVFGPLYFIAYVFFVFFVLINMFIAIINETYAGVKADLQNQSNEFEMKEFFARRMKKMMDRMKAKKSKIEKLQQAMEMTNAKHAGPFDTGQLFEQLNAQGFSQEEINNVFSQFDVDNDHKLSSTEQLKMQAKLEEEKMALVNQIAKEEEIHVTSAATGEGGDMERAPPEVTQAEFVKVSRRLARIESCISVMLERLSRALEGLNSAKKANLIRREAMTKLLQTVVTQSDSSERAAEMSAIMRSTVSLQSTQDNYEGEV